MLVLRLLFPVIALNLQYGNLTVHYSIKQFEETHPNVLEARSSIVLSILPSFLRRNLEFEMDFCEIELRVRFLRELYIHLSF